MSQHHLRAVNRTINAAKDHLGPVDDALVELARTLARQMDEAGPEPSTRLSTAYLSALININRRVTTTDAKPRPRLGTLSRMRQVGRSSADES